MALLSSSNNYQFVGLRAGDNPGSSPGRIGENPGCGACHPQPCTHPPRTLPKEVGRFLVRLVRCSTKFRPAVVRVGEEEEEEEEEKKGQGRKGGSCKGKGKEEDPAAETMPLRDAA